MNNLKNRNLIALIDAVINIKMNCDIYKKGFYPAYHNISVQLSGASGSSAIPRILKAWQDLSLRYKS
jgi:hypothetical protein